MDHGRTSDPMYRFSSIGRPLDPSWPTNRAVLALIPAGAVSAAMLAGVAPGLADTGRLWALALGAATVLGTWALGRELAPDDQRAAFIALGLGFAALLTIPGVSLALLFASLLLVRLVNRTVGLPARVLDGLVILGLTGWAVQDTGSLGVGLVAALAFALDALLPEGRRTQWGFAALSLILVAALAGVRTAQDPAGPDRVISEPMALTLPSPLVALGTVLVLLLTAQVWRRAGALRSTCDATGAPLTVPRIRWGIVVVLLMAAQALSLGDDGAASSALLWSTLAGVGLSAITPPDRRPNGA